MNLNFEIGQVYRNRIGDYEVVRLNNDKLTMRIRYLDSGDEQDVKIDIQERIWRNIGIDEQSEIRQKAAKEASYQKGYGEDCSGLHQSDFSVDVTGTAWRSRRGLAGLVAKLLSADTPYTFISWAIYGWPVAFLTHREDYYMAAFELGVRKAKFTIELDDQNAYYGLYLERSNDEMDYTWDWNNLKSGLKTRPELFSIIQVAEEQSGFRFLGRYSTGEKRFHFSDGLERGAQSLWDEENPSSLSVEKRFDRLVNVPAGRWVELYLLGTLKKDEAIRRKVQVAHDIAKGMRELLTVYETSIGR